VGEIGTNEAERGPNGVTDSFARGAQIQRVLAWLQA
jgi:hypothetical protein